MASVLQAFENVPLQLEDFVASAKVAEQQKHIMNIKTTASTALCFFPRYLRSERLLHLQLRDPSFRLSLLCQALVFCHHLLYLAALVPVVPVVTGTAASLNVLPSQIGMDLVCDVVGKAYIYQEIMQQLLLFSLIFI